MAKKFVIMILASLWFQSCALNPSPKNPPSIEGRIAQAGRQVVAGAESVLDGVDVLVTTGVLSKADATKIVLIIQRMSVEADRLQKELVIIDNSKDEIQKTAGIRRALAILKLIQQAVIEAGLELGNDPNRKSVVTLLLNISNVVIEIARFFPSTSTSLIDIKEIYAVSSSSFNNLDFDFGIS